jgi:hypothetical protein
MRGTDLPLTPDEDEELRRIHVLAQYGELPEAMQERYRELRERDQRREIAEPSIESYWSGR